MEKRQRRRQDILRMKAKAKRLRVIYRAGNWDKLYDHLAHCSGRCCGNPRRWEKPKSGMTMQERRAFQAEPVT